MWIARDDGSELRVEDDRLLVHLTHCKYVDGGKPRAQVGDLYEVCGQAQKSAIWKRSASSLIDYLLRRERKRRERDAPTGFMKGDASDLYALADRAPLLRAEFTIAIAQPGLSAARASNPQLELLAATEVYVRETTASPLEVFCSP